MISVRVCIRSPISPLLCLCFFFFSPAPPARRPACLVLLAAGCGSHSTPLHPPVRLFASPSSGSSRPHPAAAMPGDHGSKVDISFAGRFTASAIAACFAEICTIPLDTAKVRLQLQKNVVAAAAAGDAAPALPKYRGLLGTAATIAREEGAAALWKGIVPGLHRQCIYGGLRIGLYEPVKSFYVGKDHVGDVPLSKKVAAGFTTGAIAISIANPTDLVKVRLQAEGKLAPGVPRRYTGAMDAYSKIARQEGVAALWTGLGPNVARNAIINAAELASYDQVKQTILKLPGFKDDVVTHLFAGLGAGFFAVCVGSPVDVVKSRMMGDSAYKSTLDCFVKTLKNDGPLAFYKGFLPNFARLGSWNVIMFLTLEQVQKMFVRKPAS
ncbi:mitochondrial uncoupling protein 1 [Sorghum bicolor]|uniref:Uncoupling protein n=1 Tax=Sorghum bicolor TaxID=4558 RepID=A0A1Z5RKE0_SORBI|nr:mitochondrial uncoupling protein 1 [Sorghum bicolor]OQU84127.1 hypothetical protein SORBI_3005G231900 [Sorghum bicolor]|eukprot:XP_002450079.1 mitochondrial uncoupling protein 1 [Sorghum bicolor]